MVNYINEKLSRSKYGNELIYINSSTLETIEKVDFDTDREGETIESISCISEENDWDWSRVKSFENGGFYLFFSGFCGRPMIYPRVHIDCLNAFSNLEYLGLEDVKVNVNIFNSLPKLKNLRLIDCYFFDQEHSQNLFDPDRSSSRDQFDPRIQVCNLNHLEVFICIFTNEYKAGFIFGLAGFPSLVWLKLSNIYLTHSHLESIKSLAHQLVVLDFNVVEPSEDYLNVLNCEKPCEGLQAESDGNATNSNSKSNKMKTLNLEDEFASLFTTGTFWKLKKLAIKHQYFTSIKSDWFLRMPILEVLVLRGNEYKRIEDRSFASLRNLKTLDLSNLNSDGIDIETNAFEGLQNLKNLYLNWKLRLTGVKLSAFLQMVKNSNVQNFKELCDHLDNLDLNK